MKTLITHATHALLACGLAAPLAAAPPSVTQTADGRVTAGEREYASWNAYVNSDEFKASGRRCGVPPAMERAAQIEGGGGSDCAYNFTNPAAIYDPSTVRYRIPVVVHVIRQNDGVTGHISETMVQSQIDILNEDFLALPGSNGGNGTDVQVEFYLATVDPSGNPTNGITYSNNTTWFNDGGSYWNSLAWDTNRYMNIYTNTAAGNLGYVPDLPQGGIAGSNEDRVVVLWSSFGRNGPIGAPFDQGRTTTHEVGHYLGLEHTFNGGCSSASACYTNGDLICDTNPQANPTNGCSGSSCGSPDPIRNYMDYSDDLCMEEFTPEQSRRMRCSLEHYRSMLYELIDPGPSSGACCQADGSCTIESPADCAGAGGTYQGNDTTCSPDPCAAPPTGACCVGTACTIETSAACGAAGGTWQGAGTACSPNPCQAPTGACCLDNECTTGTQADCNGAGGTYQGNGSSCAGDPCAAPSGPCGDPGAGSCDVANGTPGCSDADCCETVCAQDPFCCDTEWDGLCADAAASLCGGGGGACPGSGSCTEPNGSPGCADSDCCAVVCAADPYCCNVEWDAQCAAAAASQCSTAPPPCPGDLDGDGTVGFGDVLAAVGQFGPCVACPADLDGDGDVDFGDVLAVIGAWGNCP